MVRIFLDEKAFPQTHLTVTGSKARYLTTVLRCKKGDEIYVTDCNRDTFSATITESKIKSLTLYLSDQIYIDTESKLHITLVQGLLKGDKMDIVIQKATELGVKKIIPVITTRCQPRQTRKVPRWKKIAEESARQSGRILIPEINEPLNIKEFTPKKGQTSEKGIIFWEKGGDKLYDIIKTIRNTENITLVTGPEGGFTKEEVTELIEKGFSVATLGPRILRAETAAIVAISIIQYELGDIG